ncbi:MAG: hypothetical protein AB1679_08915 [Actinomycetota bacterium]|jgi:hypothetical protein
MLTPEPGDAAAQAEDVQAIGLGDDVILLTYRARRPDRVSLRSSLWVRGAEGWKLLFHQGTLCPGSGMDKPMGDKQRDITPDEDGRPVEVREGPEPQPDDEAQDDIPDRSTIDNVGY